MIQPIVFFILIILYTYVGLNSIKKYDVKGFMLLTVLLPITPSMTPLHTKFQICIYYFFCLVVVFVYLYRLLMSSKTSWKPLLYGFAIVIFITFYLFYTFVLLHNTPSIINLFKDIKPLIFLFFGFIFIFFYKKNRIDWNGKLAKKILKWNCIASLFWFFILNGTNFINIISPDRFYQLTDTRYSSLGTVYVLLYFIAGLAYQKKFNKLELLYILIPIFLSGNRTSFLILASIYIMNMFFNSKNVITLLKRIFAFSGAFIILFSVVFNLNEKLKERILTVFDIESVISQLTNFRFAPFIKGLKDYEWYHYILGNGLGKTIFIPWFVWRKNIDNYNIYMDNIYLTLYIKYGILCLFVFFILLSFINALKGNKRFKIYLIVYLAILGFTTAFMYQVIFLFMLFTLAVFENNISKDIKTL